MTEPSFDVALGILEQELSYRSAVTTTQCPCETCEHERASFAVEAESLCAAIAVLKASKSDGISPTVVE